MAMPDIYQGAHQFEEVYKRLGIDLDTLGCVMLDLEMKNPLAINKPEMGLSSDDLYTSAVESRRYWLDGLVAERKAHVPLMYGLLAGPTGRVHPWDVDAVLYDWAPPREVAIDRFVSFPSPYPRGDPDHDAYECIAGAVDLRAFASTLEAHKRLSSLPHIDTFQKAHVTIAYVHKGMGDLWLSALNETTIDFVSTGLNYGTAIGGKREF